LQTRHSRGQRAFANLADARQVLLPIRGLGEFLEKHVSENLAHHIRWIAHRSLTGEGQIAGLSRAHPLRNAGLILGEEFENDVTGRHSDCGSGLTRTDAFQSLSELWAEG
jgi:hypothetical protein